MKHLNFEVKRNLHKPPRIYVRSSETGELYGGFIANHPEKFTDWEKLTRDEIIELKHYMNNLTAVGDHLGVNFLNEQADFRLRLPITLVNAINAITELCNSETKPEIRCDIFSPLLSTIIQELKIATTKLPAAKKTNALTILDALGLAEYKKINWSHSIKAIFSELVGVPNKSEKLGNYAKLLFNKDKSYSPHAIQKMALGETSPGKWFVCCGVAVLLDEKKSVLCKVLNEDAIFMLFAKQLLDHGKKEQLMELVKNHNLSFLIDRIKNYSPKQNER